MTYKYHLEKEEYMHKYLQYGLLISPYQKLPTK